MPFRIALAALLLLAPGIGRCAPLQWQREEIAGHHYSLDDRGQTVEFSFSGNGWTFAKSGPKDGPPIESTLQWKIEGDRLRMSDGDRLALEWQLVGRSGASVSVIARAGGPESRAERYVVTLDKN